MATWKFLQLHEGGLFFQFSFPYIFSQIQNFTVAVKPELSLCLGIFACETNQIIFSVFHCYTE